MPRNFKSSSMPKFTKFTVASKMLDLRLQQTPLTIQLRLKTRKAVDQEQTFKEEANATDAATQTTLLTNANTRSMCVTNVIRKGILPKRVGPKITSRQS
ncbi:hypothetical protein PoB_007264500 [Plakobranchus ocellatus]|uniref:Uncharacterized protein n=1 Tax=Plakobranchus ocellatus TaxID=259542 RepID=A0AAV4DQ06_9GAST|nr:hypothetical protein PoB_007264500 [Plakobranchus ocellatus]